MKFKSLINIISKDIEISKTVLDEGRIYYLKTILILLRTSRTKEKFIINFNDRKNIFNPSIYDKLMIEIIDKRINELNERLTHEYMFYDNFSDTKEVIKRLETEIEFYVDLKERLCK